MLKECWIWGVTRTVPSLEEAIKKIPADKGALFLCNRFQLTISIRLFCD